MIDIGVNLASKRLAKNAAMILERAHAAGVSQLIITGSDHHSNQEALRFCHQWDNLFFTAGFHPHHAQDWQPRERLLIQILSREEKCVAVGEMGLDYFRNLSSPNEQRRCFADQLELAKNAKKPVFLHERQAYKDFSVMLKEALPELVGAVWHCFTGTRSQMEEMADLGVYFGVTGWICDEQRGTELREVVEHIPHDRLMIESDAPYLTPKTLAKAPHYNEPCYLNEVLKMVAFCRNEDMEALERQLDLNSQTFFKLA